MQKMKQNQIAQELGISKSYLSMILSGQRKPTPELLGKLQAIPGVHKVVNSTRIIGLPSRVSRVRVPSPAPVLPDSVTYSRR